MLTVEDLKRQLDPDCEHVFEQLAGSIWDEVNKKGEFVYGLTAQCEKCKGTRRFTDEEWGKETQKIIRVKITQEDAQNIIKKLQQAHEDYIAPTEHAIMTKNQWIIKDKNNKKKIYCTFCKKNVQLEKDDTCPLCGNFFVIN